MNACPKSLVIREAQNNTTVRYYFIFNTMVVININKNNKERQDVEESEPLFISVGSVKWSSCCGEQQLDFLWWFLKKLSIELPYDHQFPLLGMYPKESKQILKCQGMHGHSWSFHNSQKVEMTLVSMNTRTYRRKVHTKEPYADWYML